MAKTGTTALQGFVWHNREALAQLGLSYCTGFRGRNHAELAVAFSSAVTPLTRREGVYEGDDRTQLRDQLKELLGDPASAPAHLVSSEHLTTLVRDKEDVAALADFLHAIYDEVIVLVVIRRADYWTPSAYVEAVKAAQRRGFDSVFIARRRHLLDQRDLLGRWGAAFGDENVRAIPFLESDKNETLRLPGRVLAAAGIEPGAIREWPLAPKLANTSLSAYATEVLRHFSIERADKDAPMRTMARRKPIIDVVRRRWPGPPPALTPEAAVELDQQGWVRTGLARTPYAAGIEGWDEWEQQPDAPTAPLLPVRAEDVRMLTRILRERDLIELSWSDRVRRQARRTARRALRRG
jgi:hypothetical protein